MFGSVIFVGGWFFAVLMVVRFEKAVDLPIELEAVTAARSVKPTSALTTL